MGAMIAYKGSPGRAQLHLEASVRMTLEEPAETNLNRKVLVRMHGCECYYRTIDVTAVLRQSRSRLESSHLTLDVHLATFPTKSARTKIGTAHQWAWRPKTRINSMITMSGYH
jgi:hypothetical protein